MDERIAIIADPNYGFAKEVYNSLYKKKTAEFIPLKITNFADGEFKIKINRNIRNKKCFYIANPGQDPCRWFSEIAFVNDAMRFSTPSLVVDVFPYLRFARQDRKDESRTSVNSKVIAKIVSNYADRGLTIDLHAPQIQEYFDIPFDNLYSFPVLIDYLQKNHNNLLNNLVVFSPDAGGVGRVRSFTKRLNQKLNIGATIGFGNKIRERKNQVEKIDIIGDVKGKNILTLDDILDTGGTLSLLEKELRRNGAKEVYSYVTHGLFTKGIGHLRSFDRLIVGNTIKNEYKEIETMDLSKLFGEAIYRTVVGESLSVLFD